MTNKQKKQLKEEFFAQLEEKLEELYPRGDKERGKALVFNAWSNVVFRRILSKL